MTGSKFVYFQSAYTGANKDEKIEPPVSAGLVSSCGSFNSEFYQSSKHNARIRQASRNVNEYDTQLSYAVRTIEAITDANRNESIFRYPRVIFKNPLKAVYPDLTEWR